jgi:DNA polymerase elongation subunit (family B)
MIIGVEVQNKDLMISYYDKSGKISYIRKRLSDHEIFNWVESEKPTIYKNWDGKPIKRAKSDPKWLTRTRIEELIIEKLSPEEIDMIYDFDNLPRKDYVDIEIGLTSDEFPKPEKAAMPVCLISFCNEEGVNYVLSIMKSEEHPNGLTDSDISRMEKEINEYFRNIIPHSDKDRSILDQEFKIKHKFFKTEDELLEFYFHQVIPRQSFLTGWNFIDFDWQYLMNRAKKRNIDPLQNMQSNKTFNKRHKLPVHLGILDYMHLFQDPGYKPYKVVENYTLDYIANKALNVTKLKHPYKNMREFQQDVYMFTKYNVIDIILVKLLEDKFGLLDVAFSLANTAQIEVNKIHSPVHVTEVLMCREFLNMDRRMMKKPWSSGEDKVDTKYEGAYVMPPVPGYYEYVACYDFKSMYPNIQMQFNISPDSYLGKKGMIRVNGSEISTKNDTYFDGRKDSVARTILNRLYNARITSQDEIKKLKFSK